MATPVRGVAHRASQNKGEFLMHVIESRNRKETVELPATKAVAAKAAKAAVATKAEVAKPRGRPKSVEPGNRVHLYLPDSLVTRLHQIQRDTHAGSLTEVVKSALQLYAAALEEHKNGGAVYFKRKDENVERQLALFI